MLSLADISRLSCALIACTLVVSGCGDNGTRTPVKPPTVKTPPPTLIGFVVQKPDSAWCQNEWTSAQECAHMRGFCLEKVAVSDGQSVISAIDTLAAKDAKGLIICAPDVKLGSAIINEAETKNMKVYTIDDQLLAANGMPMTDIPFIGLSVRTVGEKVGKVLYNEFTRRKWNVEETGVCVITCDALPTAKDRTDGAVGALKDAGFPEDRIFTSAEENPSIAAAQIAAEAVLVEHPEIKKWLVCSTNDDGVIGAVRAMEGADFQADSIIGIGIGIAGANCVAEFRNPKPTGFFASCLISPKRHGYEAAENLFKWIKDGIRPPMDTRTEGVMIYRSNYKTVVKQEGWQLPAAPVATPARARRGSRKV